MSTALMEIEPSLSFELPKELEAHEPPEARGLRRDEVRLLVSRRGDDSIRHARFHDLPSFLSPGDLLVYNQSGTVPAAVPARTSEGQRFDLHFSTQLPGALWIVEPRKIELHAGAVIRLPDHASVQLLARYRDSKRLWIAQVQMGDPILAFLARWGKAIRYPYVRRDWPMKNYQTVFASRPGSAEMPSAGRPFTESTLEQLWYRGVRFAPILLHTGVASLENHEKPYDEYYEVPSSTMGVIGETKALGHRVVAIGTTVVRALESSLDEGGNPIASRGWTDLLITPERRLEVVDALLTGFHEPKASHLSMLRAFASESHLERAYEAALTHGYLWHEFGDLHLIL